MVLFGDIPYNFDNVFSAGRDNENSSIVPQRKLEKKFGQSPVFVASTLKENGGVRPGASSAELLKEAIHVISCGYEDRTEWGKEVCCLSCIRVLRS